MSDFFMYVGSFDYVTPPSNYFLSWNLIDVRWNIKLLIIFVEKPIPLFGKVFVKDLWKPLCAGAHLILIGTILIDFILIVSYRTSLTLWVSNRNTQSITSLKKTRSYCRHPIRSGYSKIRMKPLLCKSPLYIWKNGGFRAIVLISKVLQY